MLNDNMVTELPNEITPLREKKVKRWRALIAYWILGLCNNYGYVVMLSAAHDILGDLSGEAHSEDTISNITTTVKPDVQRECNHISTGAILLADIVPALIIKFTAPFLPFYVHVRVAVCVAVAASGFLLVAFANTESLAIAGVVMTSLASGFGEVSFLQYSSFYSKYNTSKTCQNVKAKPATCITHCVCWLQLINIKTLTVTTGYIFILCPGPEKNVVSTWSSGTGGAGILGSISYAALAKLGLQTALLIMLIIPVMMAIAFWIILPKPDPNNIQCVLELTERNSNEKSADAISKSLKEKLKILPGLMKFMFPLGAVYLLEYFINQGLFELVQFDNSALNFKEQYHWLNVDYQIGVFISRSSVNLFHVKKIWLLAVLQLINVILFTFEAIFYYIPSIWIVFTLVLWEGLLGGAAYVNTFYKISQEVKENFECNFKQNKHNNNKIPNAKVPEDRKQFSMSVTSLSDTIGITLAGIAALPVHNAICTMSKPVRLTY